MFKSYKIKSAEIKAVQFTKNMAAGKEPLPACVHVGKKFWMEYLDEPSAKVFYIKQDDDYFRIKVGDVIVQNSEGKYSVKNQESFFEIYEEATEANEN